MVRDLNSFQIRPRLQLITNNQRNSNKLLQYKNNTTSKELSNKVKLITNLLEELLNTDITMSLYSLMATTLMINNMSNSRDKLCKGIRIDYTL